MIRTLLILSILIQTPLASAGGISEQQRRGMSELLTRFNANLTKTDVQTFVDAEAEEYEPMSDAERLARLEIAARWTAEAADRVIRSARTSDLEATRANMNELLRQLARAGGLVATSSREEIGRASYRVIENSVFGGSIGGAFFMLPGLFTTNEIMFAGGMFFALGCVVAGFPTLGYLENRKAKLSLPGVRRFTRSPGQDERETQFWNSVRTHMNEDIGPSSASDDLGQLIARELKGVTLDQACSSALLLAPSARQTEVR